MHINWFYFRYKVPEKIIAVQQACFNTETGKWFSFLENPVTNNGPVCTE